MKMTTHNKMGKALLVVGVITMATFMGCKKSEEGGRAGNDTFRVVVPMMSTSIKQGEVQVIDVSVDRGAGFKQAITLKVKAPSGLKVEPNNAKIESGDKNSVQLVVTAAEDAPLGKQTIRVLGTPEKGQSAETEFTVTISAK